MNLIRFNCAMLLSLVVVSTLFAMAQNRKARPEARLELVVLGSGGPRSFGRASTSYLVLMDGTPRILVDAGPGAFQAVGKLGLDLAHMDVVLLTHLHIDHSADLPALFLHRSLTSEAPIRFRIFGPQAGGDFPNTSQFVHLLFGPNGAYDYQRTFGEDETFEVADLPTALDSPAREIVTESDLRIHEIATHHGDCPSVAYRIDYKDRSITFSGDMDSSALPNLTRLAQDTDLLVFHSAVLDPPNSPKILYTLHTPPRKIGQAAHDARARHLLLSHIAPDIEESEPEVLRSIAASYHASVRFAHDGMRVAIEP